MCIYIYVYMYVCMYVCMHVCMYVRTYVCMYVCMYDSSGSILHKSSRDPALCFQGVSGSVHATSCAMACVYHQALATQELEWQGIGHLRGICSSLVSSGAAGKHKQNIRRDMLRKLSAKNPEIKVP